MNRQKVIDDIKYTLGKVPDFLKNMPDDTLEYEWGLFKRFEVEETSIPAKYKELIGIATASILHCWYCTNFHKAMAEMQGATEQEIQEAVLLGKMQIGWSTYLNGMLYDRDKFIKELHSIGEYMAAHAS